MKTVAATQAKSRLGAILDDAQREPIVIRRGWVPTGEASGYGEEGASAPPRATDRQRCDRDWFSAPCLAGALCTHVAIAIGLVFRKTVSTTAATRSAAETRSDAQRRIVPQIVP